jgi:hypothetical protein
MQKVGVTVKLKLHDFVVQSGKWPYPVLRVCVVPRSKKVFMFWALDMFPLVSWHQLRPYITSQTYGYLRQLVSLRVGNGKSVVLLEMMKTILSEPRVWARLRRCVPWKTKSSNTSGFSTGNEKLIMWPGYSRVRKTRNVTRLRSTKDNP